MRIYFQWTPVLQKINNVCFDGINDNQLSLVAHANESRYKVYVLKQTDENTARNPKKLSPAIAGKDCLQSILLHRECDRCVLGIKFVKPTTGKIHRIDIKDVSPCNSKLVASLVTNFVIK